MKSRMLTQSTMKRMEVLARLAWKLVSKLKALRKRKIR